MILRALCCASLAWFAGPASAKEPGAPAHQATPVEERLAELEARLRDLEQARDAGPLERRLRAVEEAPQRVDQQVSRVLSLMESFMAWLDQAHWILAAVVTLFGLVAGFLGFKEYKQVRALRLAAEEALSKALEVEARATQLTDAARGAQEAATQTKNIVASIEKEAREHLDGLRSQADSMKVALLQLPELDERSVIVTLGASRDPLQLAKYEDCDDALRTLLAIRAVKADDPQLVTLYRRLGEFWRAVRHYPRALARLRAAIAIGGSEPAEVQAQLLRELGRTFYYYAADQRTLDAEDRRALLEEGRKHTDGAVRLLGSDSFETLLDRQFAADEEARLTGSFSEAIAAGKKALANPLAERSEDGWMVAYNLACSYVLGGFFEEALATFRTFARRKAWSEVRQLVLKDPDFEALLRDHRWTALDAELSAPSVPGGA